MINALTDTYDQSICNEKKSIPLLMAGPSPPWCQYPQNGTYPLVIAVFAYNAGVTAVYNATVTIR